MQSVAPHARRFALLRAVRYHRRVNIHDHELLQNLGKLAAPILAQRKRAPRSRLDVGDRYVVSALVSAGEVVTVLDQLAYAVDSLSGYRRPKRAHSNYATRAQHVAYHLENHVIRAAALGDRVLQLINIAFSLGLPNRACTWIAIAENAHVKNTNVCKSLGALRKFLESKRTARNIVVHQRRYTDNELHEIEGYFLLEQIDRQAGTETPIVVRSHHMFKTMADQLVSARRSELRKFNDEAAAHIGEIFTSLDPIVQAAHTVAGRHGLTSR